MALSDTMSNPNEWLQFYNQQNFPSGQVAQSEETIAVTVATATTVPTATSPSLEMVNSSSTSSHLSPEGRVSKPIRRRSRASRRTPTTLLNTDTTNFRAMVQQFTGGPSAPFAPTASSSGLPNLGFGFGPRHANPAGFMVAPPPVYHLQQQQQQQQLFQQQQQQNQQFLYGVGSNSNTEGGDNTFFQRLSNPRPSNVADHGGFLMDQGGRFFPSSSNS